MKQSTKVSLKQSKIEIKKSVISFTAMQSKKVDDVISVIETLIDMNEGFTKDKAQRIALIVEYIIERRKFRLPRVKNNLL